MSETGHAVNFKQHWTPSFFPHIAAQTATRVQEKDRHWNNNKDDKPAKRGIQPNIRIPQHKAHGPGGENKIKSKARNITARYNFFLSVEHGYKTAIV